MLIRIQIEQGKSMCLTGIFSISQYLTNSDVSSLVLRQNTQKKCCSFLQHCIFWRKQIQLSTTIFEILGLRKQLEKLRNFLQCYINPLGSRQLLQQNTF